MVKSPPACQVDQLWRPQRERFRGAESSASSCGMTIRIPEFVSGFIVSEQALMFLMTKSQQPGTEHLAHYQTGHLIYWQHSEGWVTPSDGNVLGASGASSSDSTDRTNQLDAQVSSWNVTFDLHRQSCCTSSEMWVYIKHNQQKKPQPLSHVTHFQTEEQLTKEAV